MMTAGQAREFRAAHDARVRELTRMTRIGLTDLRVTRLHTEGAISYGGPRSKDELIRELLEHDYPLAKLNEATHVLYHKPGEPWPACNWCHPHQGFLCECDLREPSPPPSATGVSAPVTANPPTTAPTTAGSAGITTPSSTPAASPSAVAAHEAPSAVHDHIAADHIRQRAAQLVARYDAHMVAVYDGPGHMNNQNWLDWEGRAYEILRQVARG